MLRRLTLLASIALAAATAAGCGGSDDRAVELTFATRADAQPDGAILRARLQRLGISDATVRAAGERRVVVQLPGTDPGEARSLARQLAADSPLRFYDWEPNVVGEGCRIDPDDTRVTGGAQAGSTAFGLTRDAARQRAAACPGTIAIRARGVDSDRWYVLRDRPALTGATIRNPQPFRDDGTTGTGESKVTFDFTPDGLAAWRTLTRAVARRDRGTAEAGGDPQHLAVVLDDRLLATPSVAYRDFPDGIDARFGAQIDGGLTERAARELAVLVTDGTLPAPLALETVRMVG